VRELIYIGDRKVAWREAPDPLLQEPTDAIVRPVAATTCDVDKMIIAGKSPVPPPFAVGHECVAEVVDVADGVTHVEPGDLVVVPWHIACGRCERCDTGLFAHCLTVPYMAMYGAPIGGEWGGLFSDLVRVPWADAMLVPLPAGLDPVAMASASDNWSLAAVRRRVMRLEPRATRAGIVWSLPPTGPRNVRGLGTRTPARWARIVGSVPNRVPKTALSSWLPKRRKSRCYAGSSMARPGLEPGHHDFQSWIAISLTAV
jgi:hypothetical protein